MLRIEKQTLKSGLTVVTIPMETESVTVLTVVKAGSRDEKETQYGGAHFLEHFVFKGTKKYPKVNDISRAIDEIGGIQNAFTSSDYTGYWVKVASDHWQKGLEVVAQLVCEPLLPEGELEKEKGTIVEELKMYEDNYPSKALEVLDGMVFPGSPLGRPVIGFEKTIRAMKISDLGAFREAWYAPENMVVVVVGGIKQPEKLMLEIEEQFSSIKGKQVKGVREGYEQVFTQKEALVQLTDKKTEQAHLALGLRSFRAKDDGWYTVEILNNILGGNMSSRLWNEIREKRGLAYYVRTFNDAHMDQGMVGVRAGIRLGKVEEAVKVMVGELEKIASKGITVGELTRGIASVVGRMKLDLEDSQDAAMMVADDWVMRDGEIRPVEEVEKEIEAVTLEEVKAMAAKLFDKGEYNLSIVGPIKDKEKISKAIK